MSNETRMVEAEAAIELSSKALGDGFVIPCDGEGLGYKCEECGGVRAGSYGEHTADCSVGIAISAIDAYKNKYFG